MVSTKAKLLSKNRKLDILGVVVFTAILAFGVGLQAAQPWTGTLNTLSDGYMEVDNLNVTSEVYWNSLNRTDTLAYPEQAASYIIFKSGSTYRAKDGSDGQIDYSGTDGGTVFSSVLTALDGVGGQIFFKKGIFDLGTTNFTLPFGVEIIGENRRYTILQWSGTGTMFIIKPSGGSWSNTISSLKMIHTSPSSTPRGILLNQSYGTILEHLCIEDFGKGIDIDATAERNLLYDIDIFSPRDYGIKLLQSAGLSGSCAYSEFIKINIAGGGHSPNYGLNFDVGTHNTILGLEVGNATTAIRINNDLTYISGGGVEDCTTGIEITSSAALTRIIGFGYHPTSVTTPLSDSSSDSIIIGYGDYTGGTTSVLSIGGVDFYNLNGTGGMAFVGFSSELESKDNYWLVDGSGDETEIEAALNFAFTLGGGIVLLEPGTYNATVTIDENDVKLVGNGWGTIIDGGIRGHAISVTGNNVMVEDLQCKTTAGGGNAYDALRISGTHTTASKVYVSESDSQGINILNSWTMIEHCFVYDADVYGIVTGSGGDNSSIIDNQIDTSGNDGIHIHADSEDCLVDGNRITGWTGEAIDDDSGTSTVGDNETT